MVNEHQIEQKLIEANPVSQPEHLHEDPSEAQALLTLIMERRDAMTMTKQPATIRAPRGPRWQPAAIAAASAVLILVVIGVAAFIGFRSDESETANQPTTLPAAESTLPTTPEIEPPVSTLPPVVTTLPPAPATLQEGTWEHETSATGFGPGQVFATSVGLVGTGSREGIFLSQDGIEWSMAMALPKGEIIEDATLLPGEPPLYTTESYVRSVVEFKGAVYAFATVRDEAHGPNQTVQRIAYRTTDGVNWEGITYATDEGWESAVAGDTELLVILESDGPSTPVMRSEDGLSWARHETGLDIEVVSGGAAFVDGRYLAVVEEPESADYPSGKRSMAESSDGIEWDIIAGSEFPFDAYPRELTEYGGRLYMGGLVFDENQAEWQQGMIFYSDDGASWQQAVLPVIADLRVVTNLVPTEHGLLAVGEVIRAEDVADRIVVMATTDGSSFIEVPHPGGLFDGLFAGAGPVYAAGDRIMIRGLDHETSTYHQWIWTADR